MKLEDIVGLNPWWKNPAWESEDRHLKTLARYDYVYRRKEPFMKKGTVVVYGPRQVGKTTWIKQTIAQMTKGKQSTDIFYLNVEMMKDRFELYDDIKTILGLYRPGYVFIDEISAVEDWERTIKALVDEGAFEEKYVLLTGSSSVNIMKKAERLPGRMAQGQNKFRYYPLGFREVAELYGVVAKTPQEAIASLDKLNPLLYRYFIHGGFVRIMNEFQRHDTIEEDIFSIYAAWIDGGLSRMKRSPETTNIIMNGIAIALTNEVSWSSLAAGINHVTVSEYIELLRNMFVVEYLEKSKVAAAGATKNKKIYFTDPFIYWLALFKSRRINSVKLADLDSTVLGKMAELSVYANLVQYLDKRTGENEFDARRYIHFEKEKSGEVDFLVKFGKRTVRLESKFGGIGKERDGVVYLTQDKLARNKLPLAVFLMFPEDSLKLLGK
jgi:predicted AAA+ superfamily ATPase